MYLSTEQQDTYGSGRLVFFIQCGERTRTYCTADIDRYLFVTKSLLVYGAE
jgi:hypothetical protein